MTIRVTPLSPTSESARAFLGGRKKLLIDGAWAEPAGGSWFASIDPATGATLAEIAEGGVDDVDAAVASARRAFESDTWRGMTPTDRGRLLFRIADLIEANADALAEIETLDQANPTARPGSARSPAPSRSFAIMVVSPTRSSAKRFRPRSAISLPARNSLPIRFASQSASSPRSRPGIHRCSWPR